MGQLRILCFGDSLTEGYTRSGTMFHPYAGSMKATLEDALPKMRFHVDVEGLSGDKVCPPGLFSRRIEAKYKQNTYDWIVLLGGTNDLGWGAEPSKIFSCLKNIEDVALNHNTKVLVMTVPEVGMVHKDLDDRRNALNASIKEQCDDSKIFLFDLHDKIPYHSLTPTERQRIWDDAVHFTAGGYDLMGKYVAERLVEILSPLTQIENGEAPGDLI